MASTHLGVTGQTYYAKLVGSSVSPWSTSIVAFVESSQLGVFAAATDDTLSYVVYLQAGGSPASSDEIDALVPGSPLIDLAAIETAISDSETAVLAAIDDMTPPSFFQAAPIVQRSTDDVDDIRFAWPVTGATVTGQVSLGGAAFGAVAGAISFLRTEAGSHTYQLAYNAADREEGSVRYLFTDGTYTRAVNLEVFGAVSGGGGGIGEFLLDVQVNSSVSGTPGVYGVYVIINGSLKRQFTDTLGEAIFRVEAGSYTLSFVVPPGYEPVPDLVVSNIALDREVTVTISPLSIPILNDSLLCNCLLVVLDQLGEPIAGATITPAMVGLGTASGNSFVFNDPVTFTTDADGRAYMPLHRKQLYDFVINVDGVGETQLVRRIPDLPTYRITVSGQTPTIC